MSSHSLRITQFGNDAPLFSLPRSNQRDYLIEYLADLGAASVLEEPCYFDRDYLAEFSAFYSVSSRSYANICRRLHFFAGKPLTRDRLRAAVRGNARVVRELEDSYLGFTVLRPIIHAPFGRTVLRWYPDLQPDTPRVVTPSRPYVSHIAGISLQLDSLAWQQQDMGVSACATIALWSMLHSSAFDDHHAIPTTADITRFAHRTASLGSRIFPSEGLTLYQILEAIKEASMAPSISEGDVEDKHTGRRGFTRERFSTLCASLIRSGYPVLIGGHLQGPGGHLQELGGHAVCVVGFRESAVGPSTVGHFELYDASIQYLYIHDDNLGPNVRFEIIAHGTGVALKASAPPPRTIGRTRSLDPTVDYPVIVPEYLIAGVHEGLRMSSDALQAYALKIVQMLTKTLGRYRPPKQRIGLTAGTRFIKNWQYVQDDLGRTLAGNPQALARARLALCERVEPMSLHVGVIRIGLGKQPLMDILLDTTDSHAQHSAFCHVAFHKDMLTLAADLKRSGSVDLGAAVAAY